MVLGSACAAPQSKPSEASAKEQAWSFAPSPLLSLARSERETPPVRRHWAKLRFQKPAAMDTTLDEDGIARTVRIHPFRLGTPEELARSTLRHAESRRPRERHPTRYLIRATRVRAPTRAAKRRARAMVDARDPAIAACLAQDLAARPSVILRAPAALVLEQARRTGATDYTLSVAFNGRHAPSIETTPPVHDTAATCLRSALTPGPHERPRNAQVELVAFAQDAHDGQAVGLHQRLANEAATLGWIELERGAHDVALSYFEDAHWLYHRPEYELLQAMALQKMGRPNMALTRYHRYVDARPEAPDTAMVRDRIAALEAARTQGARPK